MRRRSTIVKLINKKEELIKSLENEIVNLNREGALLSDKKQQFTEENQDILICGRPKKYETRLIGKIHWREGFTDQDTGEVVFIDRSQVVRVNGEWI